MASIGLGTGALSFYFSLSVPEGRGLVAVDGSVGLVNPVDEGFCKLLRAALEKKVEGRGAAILTLSFKLTSGSFFTSAAFEGIGIDPKILVAVLPPSLNDEKGLVEAGSDGFSGSFGLGGGKTNSFSASPFGSVTLSNVLRS